MPGLRGDGGLSTHPQDLISTPTSPAAGSSSRRREPWRAGNKQINYFLRALGELLQRMNDPDARYGLAFPDNRQYRGLVDRLPKLAKQRLGLVVYFVRREEGRLAVEETE